MKHRLIGRKAGLSKTVVACPLPEVLMGFAISASNWLSLTGYSSGGAAYDAGYRMHSTFQIGLIPAQ